MTERPTRDPASFDLGRFLPYLLNQAAEVTAEGFRRFYRDQYGMTRTQWRMMALLARLGPLTASRICEMSRLEKTKVSRAVAVMEERGWLLRGPVPGDRRRESLTLTEGGLAVFAELGRQALDYDAALFDRLGAGRGAELVQILIELARVEMPNPPPQDQSRK